MHSTHSPTAAPTSCFSRRPTTTTNDRIAAVVSIGASSRSPDCRSDAAVCAPTAATADRLTARTHS
ncbi:hypothetical protein BC831DRAFT_451543, partial [Entophlyctis helioformis]